MEPWSGVFAFVASSTQYYLMRYTHCELDAHVPTILNIINELQCGLVELGPARGDLRLGLDFSVSETWQTRQ